MEKVKIEINYEEFPQELYEFLQDAQLYDSSCGNQAKVIYSDKGYYIKIAEKGKLQQEAFRTKLFAQRNMGPQVLAYISEDKDYMVTRSVEGEDALYADYLSEPKQLCEMLAEAMKRLHGSDIEGVPVSPSMELYETHKRGNELKRDTFIHGDFCLPNVMFSDGEFTSFVDVGAGGVGDKHIDIYWVLWSLRYNLKTDAYREYFKDLYGRDQIDEEILKIVTEVEEGALEAYMQESKE